MGMDGGGGKGAGVWWMGAGSRVVDPEMVRIQDMEHKGGRC